MTAYSGEQLQKFPDIKLAPAGLVDGEAFFLEMQFCIDFLCDYAYSLVVVTSGAFKRDQSPVMGTGPAGDKLKEKIMKRMLSRVSILGIAFGAALTVQAGEVPSGYWRLSTFHVSNGAAATVQMVCFKANKTWYSTTEANWNGAWFANGDEIHWYGSVPLADYGNVATIGMGALSGAVSMSGKYAEWSAPGNAPYRFDRHYTYTLTYQQAECPPPKL
ncbi:hypothetical protein OC926_17025 [Pseudomonas peradeniyensis]|uniref:hypothetical protein n=1 Tax=Pseudomonas TaxID=286 RepID=UPI0021D5129E|nr:hypothetical protein [Pseudomonas peradeniyensis]MCU7281555.1 hypothetical protein [Pseudomonas peradeniyensis]